MVHARSLFFASLAFCVGTSLFAQSGSIKTTDKNGDAVNGNTYTAIEDVYVSAAALPNGDYYFQVTNSNGSVDLSGDAIEARGFTFTNGVISNNTHATGTNGGATAIQLAPFALHNDTYKVWVTTQTSYNQNSGFSTSDSKTDNFSIAQCTITGKVFYDTKQDCDPTQAGLSGWRIETYRVEAGPDPLVRLDFTDALGNYKSVVPLDTTGATTYLILVRAPVFERDANNDLVLVTDSVLGFIGESTEARWLPSDGCSNATSTPVTANAESKTGPNFGNVWFVPVDTTANSETAVFSKEFWGSKDGKTKIQECLTASPGLWPSVLNELQNPWPVGSRPTAPSSYVNAFTDPETKDLILDAANACLQAGSVGTGGTGFLRNKRGKVFVVGGKDFNREFANFSKWLAANPEGHAGFSVSREIATALLNIRCGNLGDRTLYIKTGNGLNLVSFDELVYKAVCLFLAPQNAKRLNDTGSRAAGDWLTLADAIREDLTGTDPYPFELRLGQATDSHWHPLVRLPQPRNGVQLKLLVPSMTKQFSQINTTTTTAEGDAYVWEPEEDIGSVPVPLQLYEPGEE